MARSIASQHASRPGSRADAFAQALRQHGEQDTGIAAGSSRAHSVFEDSRIVGQHPLQDGALAQAGFADQRGPALAGPNEFSTRATASSCDGSET